MDDTNRTDTAAVVTGGARAADPRTAQHPCFSSGCTKENARMHVAVAPRCNIGCKYCVRKFDCANESRPGVASTVLSPEQALEHFRAAREQLGNLKVVGIAGPGDALANWDAVRETFRLIRAEDPEVTFCLSTNGLLLPRYADALAEAGVSHLTVTMNAVDPSIGGRIYNHVTLDGVSYHGEEAGRVLLENQLAGIERAVAAGLTVKVNTVLVSGINVEHAPAVAKKCAELGVWCQNVTTMIPVEGSAFQDLPRVDAQTLRRVRQECERYLPQIYHCQQCRADAVGLLGQDISAAIDKICAKLDAKRRFAVATRSGAYVDEHFGQAARLLVFDCDGEKVTFVEGRDVTPYCQGKAFCGNDASDVFSALADCNAVLCSMIGPDPVAQLAADDVTAFHSAYLDNPAVQDAIARGGIEWAIKVCYQELLEVERLEGKDAAAAREKTLRPVAPHEARSLATEVAAAR